MKKSIVLAAIVVAVGSLTFAYSMGLKKTPVRVDGAVVNSGGGMSSSANYSVEDAILIGQPLGGASSSSYSTTPETGDTIYSGLDWQTMEEIER